jgi:hypothetical protein
VITGSILGSETGHPDSSVPTDKYRNAASIYTIIALFRHGGEEQCVQDFVGKPERKKPLGRSRSQWEDNVNKKFWEELVAYFSFIRHGSHRKRRAQQFFYCYLCIHCRGNVFTDPLPGNEAWIHIQTHRLMGMIYEDVVEMDSGVMTCIPSFMNIGSDVQKWIRGFHRHTESMLIS